MPPKIELARFQEMPAITRNTKKPPIIDFSTTSIEIDREKRR